MTIDDKIKEALDKFKATEKVVDLPKGLVLRVWANQKAQGNTPTSEILLTLTEGRGNFNWYISKEGEDFWGNIHRGNWLSPQVMEVMGSKEAFFEASTQNIDQRIQEAIDKFSKSRKISELPIGLKTLALNNQLLRNGSTDENKSLSVSFDWGNSIQGGAFWSYIDQSNWLDPTVLQVMGSKEAFFEEPSLISTTQASPKTIDLAYTKIRVNTPEESILFQEFAFKQGVTWPDSMMIEGQPQFVDKPYLYIDTDNNFSYGVTEGNFKDAGNREISLQQLGLKAKKIDIKRIKQLTQDEIEWYFNTDGVYVSPSIKRLALGIDPKYKAYVGKETVYNTYVIEIVDLLDQINAFIGVWPSYIEPNPLALFLDYNSSLIQAMQSETPDVYSAFNDVIDQLSKKFDLPTVKVEPVKEPEPFKEPVKSQGFWRIMTKNEMVDKYGSMRAIPTWNQNGSMDWMCGMPIKDLIKTPLSEEQIGKSFEDGNRILTDPSIDPGGNTWRINSKLVIFDTSNVKQPEPTSVKEWRFKTIQEINDQKLGYMGVGEKTMLNYVGKTLTQLDSQGFLRDGLKDTIKRIEDTGIIYIDGFGFSYRYFTQDPLPQQKGVTSTTPEPTSVKKEWKPQDLVGKKLLFTSSGKKYLVAEFTRNNPKNKEYLLNDLTSPANPIVRYKISMNLIKKWLDGQTASGVKIIEETPTGSDYSSWTQEQLIAKRKEIKDAQIVFEEDDPEYKELQEQLDIIDTFID